MKVCLVANNSLHVSPYVKKYAQLLDDLGINYDIISKEHISKKSTIDNQQNIFFYKDTKGPWGKFIRFYNYADFVKQIIKRGSYSKVVFFTAMNAAFCYLRFGRFMKKHLEYIIDIRDYDKSFTDTLISLFLKKSIRAANAVVISSAKFKNWLPRTEVIHVLHNLPNDATKEKHASVFGQNKIRIGYFGGIGYYQQNKAMVDNLKNSDRFIFTYRGLYPSTYNIKDYCSTHGVTNVEFFGSYNDSEKKDLYRNVDIINAVYGNDSLIVTTALPNKLYDCVYYKIPIMVNVGTYLSEIVEKYSLGFSVSADDEQLSTTIEQYIENFDIQQFEAGCLRYLEYAEREQKETNAKLKSFFQKGTP